MYKLTNEDLNVEDEVKFFMFQVDEATGFVNLAVLNSVFFRNMNFSFFQVDEAGGFVNLTFITSFVNLTLTFQG